ncbi:LysR family transcriptional regulator [Fundidesulfovibrio butyratiphilus]
MELRKLRAFLAVAGELHFGRAAKRLNMTQPPLSQLIRSMEDDLGGRLFERDNRNVRLTEAGRVLEAEARRVLEADARLEEAVRRAVQGAGGTLRVGMVRPALDGPLPLAIRAFRERYPHVVLQLAEMGTRDQLEALAAGRLQVGVVRLFGPVPDGMRGKLLVREPYVLAVPLGHPLAETPCVPLAALAGLPMIWMPRDLGPALHDSMLDHCRRAGFTPHIVQEAAAKQTMLALVAAGLGVAFVPESSRRSGREGVVFRTLGAGLPFVEIGCVWPDGQIAPLTGNFVSTLLEVAQPA